MNGKEAGCYHSTTIGRLSAEHTHSHTHLQISFSLQNFPRRRLISCCFPPPNLCCRWFFLDRWEFPTNQCKHCIGLYSSSSTNVWNWSLLRMPSIRQCSLSMDNDKEWRLWDQGKELWMLDLWDSQICFLTLFQRIQVEWLDSPIVENPPLRSRHRWALSRKVQLAVAPIKLLTPPAPETSLTPSFPNIQGNTSKAQVM